MMQLTLNRIAKIRALALGVFLAALMAASLTLAAHPAHASITFTVDSTADYGDQTPGDGKCDTGTIMVIGERCTLRAAIQEANASSGADVIEFGIAGTGVHTIAPTTGLPKITGPVTINGYSQQGAQPNTKAVGSDAVLKVMLSGASAPGAEGLVMGASNSTVKGLVINRWNMGIRIDGSNAAGNKITGNYIGTDDSGTQKLSNGLGIRVYEGSYNTIGGATAAARNVISANSGSGVGIGDGGPNLTGNKVIGNYIGTDATGTQDLGNNYYGVYSEDALDTAIGGTTAGERNVISGNDLDGVAISSSGSRVMGNYIGTDATGTKDLGNADNGVYLQYERNTVGGTTTRERNVISGNGSNGVQIESAGSAGNKVTGNYIGTDKSGTAPLGNSANGVFVVGAPNNTVGGATAGVNNVISANKQHGVMIFSFGATGNKVTGNYLGTDASGTRDLGNSYAGVNVYDASNNDIGGTTAGERNVISGNDGSGVSIYGSNAKSNKVLGNYIGTDKTGAAILGNSANGVLIGYSSDNAVGGTAAGTRNVIADNDGSGVSIYGAGATGNRVLSNSIFANGGLGIDLGDDGPTPNDPGDADTGPNNLQNFPVLSSARKNSSGTTTVRGKLNSTPNNTFRVQFFINPNGADEGKTLLGSQFVSTDGSGEASFAFSTKQLVRLGQSITATATGPGGNTSEFSAPKQVVAS